MHLIFTPGTALSFVALLRHQGLPISEVATHYLEFAYLSHHTNDSSYLAVSRSAYLHLAQMDAREELGGLFPSFINVIGTQPEASGKETGCPLGANSDSFYEYLLKSYLLTRDTLPLSMYVRAANALSTKALSEVVDHRPRVPAHVKKKWLFSHCLASGTIVPLQGL